MKDSWRGCHLPILDASGGVFILSERQRAFRRRLDDRSDLACVGKKREASNFREGLSGETRRMNASLVPAFLGWLSWMASATRLARRRAAAF